MRKEPPSPQAPQDDQTAEEKRAQAAWEAWNDWKIACAVAKCSRDSQSILKRLIYRAFEKKYFAICPADYESIMADSKEWGDEFDMGIIDPAVPKYISGFTTYSGRHIDDACETESPYSKCLKDYIWLEMVPNRREGTTPLQLVEGKLIGRNGIINQIAEHYLRSYHYMLWFNYNQNRSRGKEGTADSPNESASDDPASAENPDAIPQASAEGETVSSAPDGDSKSGTNSKRKERRWTMVSMNQPKDDEDERNSQDIPDPDSVSFLQTMEDRKPLDLEKLVDELSVQEIILFLAQWTKKMNDPVTWSFIGWGKTKVSETWNNGAFIKKRTRLIQTITESQTRKEDVFDLLFLMKKRLLPEKGSEAFLKMVEPVVERILNKAFQQGE